jgi:hypothetical protein
MKFGMQIVDRSISSRIVDGLLFFVPTCSLFYFVSFRLKPLPGNLTSLAFHWVFIIGAFALCSAVFYNLLHAVEYEILAGKILKTERKLFFFKSVECISDSDIAAIVLETGKNSFIGTPKYLLVLRFKSGNAETITSSNSEEKIRALEASISGALKSKQ